MPERAHTLGQRALVGLGVFYLVMGAVGLVVNADFGTGNSASANQLLVDWNGWHAALTIVLGLVTLAAALRPVWANAFLAYNVFVNAVTAIWVLFDDSPFGLFKTPHVTADVVVHAAITAFSLAILVLELRRGRVTARRGAHA